MSRPEPGWLGPRDGSGSNDPHTRAGVDRDYRASPAAVDAALAAAAHPSAADYLGDLERAAEQLRALLERAYGDGNAFPADGGRRRLWLVLSMDSVGAVQTVLRQLRSEVETQSGPRHAATDVALDIDLEER